MLSLDWSLITHLISFSLIGTFLVLIFFSRKILHQGDWLAILSTLFCFLLSGVLFINTCNLSRGVFELDTIFFQQDFVWFTIGTDKLVASIIWDGYNLVMIMVVTFISLLVQIFSVVYMRGQEHYGRYFAYIMLFTFSMVGVLLANNLLLMFLFWELVGFSSYLLIGFWYKRKKAVQASSKAFLINRLADLGFILALCILWAHTKTLNITELESVISGLKISHSSSSWILYAGIGLLLAAIGKSAQFPLQVWLPDAMEGPTPISALMHAATMVAAGVFLLIRVSFLIIDDLLIITAIIGSITLIMGAFAAFFQTDIKRVLAYSTISQLGYMVIAVGIGATEASFFHLVTHAFFKAGLFLSVGAITYYMGKTKKDLSSKQDMYMMGGLYKKMPIIFISYTICMLSLIGIPFFSGFLSKELILAAALQHFAEKGGAFSFVFFVGVLGSGMTAFYMSRQWLLVFFGKFRLGNYLDVIPKIKIPLLMVFVLILLSVLSLGIVFSFNPLDIDKNWLVKSSLPILHNKYLLVGTLTVIMLGTVVGFLYYKSFFKNKTYISEHLDSFMKRLSQHNWFLDTIYFTFVLKPFFFLVKLIRVIEEKVINFFIEVISKGYVVLSYLVKWLDHYLVDGVVSVVVWGTSAAGVWVTKQQKGKVQLYIYGMILFMVLGIVFFWLIFF